MTEDGSTSPSEAERREEQLIEQIANLSRELKDTKAELDATRYAMRTLRRAHERLLAESTKVKVQLGRAVQDSSDSYYAKAAALTDAQARFRQESEQQRAQMGDERRVAEERLESVIHDKLDIISSQIEEIREIKTRLAEADAKLLHNGTDRFSD